MGVMLILLVPGNENSAVCGV